MAFCWFKQKTAYDMRISDWSSDVCSSDLATHAPVISQAESRNVGNAGIVIPERLPRYGIGGVNNAEPVYVVENPIDLERYRRRVPWRQINRPCQAQFANIRGVAMGEVAIMLLSIASAIARPVARLRMRRPQIGRTTGGESACK